MLETDAVPEIVSDIAMREPSTVPRSKQRLEVPYLAKPHGARRFPRCDVVLSLPMIMEGWAIQFKRIQFLGDNGKNNDYGFQKLFSPYLKDRSLLHDCESLPVSGLGNRQFVVGYSFRHSIPLLETALLHHPEHADRIDSARKVCLLESSGCLEPEIGISMLNDILQHRGLAKSHATATFTNAWRHPIGGDGLVFGWEL